MIIIDPITTVAVNARNSSPTIPVATPSLAIISDISALAGLNNLEHLELQGNNISDISPLVENSGLSRGDVVWLDNNPLSNTSVNDYISQLEARGVTVHH